MQIFFQRAQLLVGFLILASTLTAQLITTVPAAPTDDQEVTLTFDATQGTAGLENCGCDIYLHTGVITNNSTSLSDWKFVQTEWGVANPDWQLTPVAGQPNTYTYTFTPSVREYFSVPEGTEIQQIAFVFRNADGSLEGKATGGADIYVDISAGGGALSLNLVGDPGGVAYPLGKPLPITVGTTTEATIEVYDNETLIYSAVGTELSEEISLQTSGTHVIRATATANGEEVSDEFTVEARLEALFTSPDQEVIEATEGELVSLSGTSYISSDLTVSDGSQIVFSDAGTDFNTDVTLPAGAVTTYTLTSTLEGETATDYVTFITGQPEVADPPAGFRPGANNMDNGDVLLQLRAPGKTDVFVLGNFNAWSPTASGRMKKSVDGETFWLLIPAAEIDGDLIYNYLIDGEILQPDPYSTLVLDPNNDRFISEETFSGIPTYPAGASGILTWHRRSVAPFNWQTEPDYDRPDPKKMVVYELLIRDFLEDHSYKSLTDTLDYLERLGVNAIELMPVTEFENNNSWGYSVSFHMALDKYYGNPEDFKTFVDACHARGMAVIMDVVYNHAFGQSPLARMWWNDAASRPADDNPYLNPVARHPFNVGFDMNHEHPLTKEYLKVTTRYWQEEFRVDGFRFDLSKGFTQVFSGDDVNMWNQYDASRIAIIKDYADHLWSVDDECYVIMEHLAVSAEENELANYGNGMYFWSGFTPHDDYTEASMGYTSNLRNVLAGNRGFTVNNLVAYMESHDEERMQYKNEAFANSAGDYNIQEEDTGLDRLKLASAFFYTVPGPKMLWQFGELGYDYSINYCPGGGINTNCRVDPKPIRWDYRNDFDRAEVYNVISDLLYLRNNFDFFHGEVTKQQLADFIKIFNLSGDDGEVAIVGNFGVSELTATGVFPTSGDWYDYFSGETISVSDPNLEISLQPGEFHLYLDQPIERMGGQLPTGLNDRQVARLGLSVSPNPTEGAVQVEFQLESSSNVNIDLLDVSGRVIQRMFSGRLGSGVQSLAMEAGQVTAGLYFLRVSDGAGTAVRPLVIR
ncbi:T9SS type A sorting domain-containing protein [Neolewinella aurantiaca]|uniref:T9SS type A sorting domain-containing protein n=1 Tax=Neolewinella aurantiaca TaxID=2602767 RepID=A0A5C7FJE6_9BACT|nr:alpha-amylase family glycosyl hydrolase [Neolewinella aurantiaca]TXF91405.1 T9SS type A sorting domain-containing protein [Neolewinella aurantiaca]